MDIVKDEESNFALPPARDLLRTSSSLEEKEDNMMIDEPFTEISKEKKRGINGNLIYIHIYIQKSNI